LAGFIQTEDGQGVAGESCAREKREKLWSRADDVRTAGCPAQVRRQFSSSPFAQIARQLCDNSNLLTLARFVSPMSACLPQGERSRAVLRSPRATPHSPLRTSVVGSFSPPTTLFNWLLRLVLPYHYALSCTTRLELSDSDLSKPGVPSCSRAGAFHRSKLAATCPASEIEYVVPSVLLVLPPFAATSHPLLCSVSINALTAQIPFLTCYHASRPVTAARGQVSSEQ
jgi:hypothetical protein